MQRSDRSEKIAEMIGQLENAGFYGELTIKFQAGEIVLCQKSENIKLHYTRSNRHENNKQQ